jgi:hypothetical protein
MSIPNLSCAFRIMICRVTSGLGGGGGFGGDRLKYSYTLFAVNEIATPATIGIKKAILSTVIKNTLKNETKKYF